MTIEFICSDTTDTGGCLPKSINVARRKLKNKELKQNSFLGRQYKETW